MFSAHTSILLGIWDSSVGIVIMLWAGPSMVQFLAGARDFIFYKMSKPTLGPTNLLLPVWWVKHKYDGFHQSRDNVRNG